MKFTFIRVRMRACVCVRARAGPLDTPVNKILTAGLDVSAVNLIISVY